MCFGKILCDNLILNKFLEISDLHILLLKDCFAFYENSVLDLFKKFELHKIHQWIKSPITVLILAWVGKSLNVVLELLIWPENIYSD